MNMIRNITQPTNLSGTTNASSGTKDELVAAVANQERVLLYIENPATNGTGVITVSEGEDGSEANLITLSPGESIEYKPEPFNGLSFVPQGRIAIEADAANLPFIAREAATTKLG